MPTHNEKEIPCGVETDEQEQSMNCDITVTKLEAQIAEYLAFPEHFRAVLEQEEHKLRL